MCIRDRYNVGQPFERTAIDIAGSFPVTDNGNQYIMVVGDFTKWVESYTFPNQEVTTVAKEFTTSVAVKDPLWKSIRIKGEISNQEFLKNYGIYSEFERP